MFSLYNRDLNLQEYHQSWCKLTVCSMISAGSGVLFAASLAEHYIPLMRIAVGRSVSIVGSAVAVFIPFLVSLLILIHSKPWLAYFVCGGYLFSVSAVGWTLHIAFGSAGWLFRLLIQLPQFFGVSALYFLAAQKQTGTLSRTAAVYALVIMAILGMIDYIWISPFVVYLINTFETIGR